MAKYFLHVKTFSRGKGSSATRAAAYRAAQRIKDTRSGAVHDHTDRTDVVAAEITLPRQFAGRMDMAWARDRSVLWNAVQNSGARCNTRLAREVLVLLPPEMTREQRIVLARTFSRDLADRYGCAVDFAVHLPRANADQRHHHAHLLMTVRRVTPEGLGGRTDLELSGTERHTRGLGPSKGELLWMREHWADLANDALRSAGLGARIDHRSYAAQGKNVEPKPLFPQKVFYAEQQSGLPTAVGERIRRQYRERIEARSLGPQELERVRARQRAESRPRAAEADSRRRGRTGLRPGALTRAQLNEKRRARHKEHAAEVNRRRRERRRAHADEVNRKKREMRRAHLEEARLRDRESYRKRLAARGLTVRPLGPRHLPVSPAASIPSPERSVENWMALCTRANDRNERAGIDAWTAYRQGRIAERASAGPDGNRVGAAGIAEGASL